MHSYKKESVGLIKKEINRLQEKISELETLKEPTIK